MVEAQLNERCLICWDLVLCEESTDPTVDREYIEFESFANEVVDAFALAQRPCPIV